MAWVALANSKARSTEAIVKAREEGGPFKSLFDFCVRIDRQRINKRTVEALIKAGAFDAIQQNRASLIASVDRAFEFASATEANAAQVDIFGDSEHGSATQEPELVDATPWGVKERLTYEKTAVGFYLSGHLFDEVSHEVRRFRKREIGDLMDTREQQVIAGIVSDFRVINGQRGRLAIFKLDDKSDSIDATADEALINNNRNTLKDDELVIVSGRLQPGRGGFEARFQVQQVWDLASARCRFGKFLRVAVNGKVPEIARLLKDFPARTEQTEVGDLVHGLPVRLSMARGGAQVELQLGERAKFFPTDAALASWTAQAEAGKAQVIYD